MPFRLRRKESVEEAIRRIAREQIDQALDEIAGDWLEPDETVHQVRKRCKKLRGLVRLVRPALQTYQQENACFRDAARELSAVRDADVLIETFDGLVSHFDEQINGEAFSEARAALERRRKRIAEDVGDLDARLEPFAEKMRQARERIDSWSLDSRGFQAIAAGVEQTYRRGRLALKNAYGDPTAENFHEWRKRAKYHWYHMRLLRDVWKPEMTVRQDAAKELSDLLGLDHDLAVLRSVLLSGDLDVTDDGRDVQAIVGLIDRRRCGLEAEAHPLGLRLFAEKPSCLTKRLGRYWQAWRKKAKTRACVN